MWKQKSSYITFSLISFGISRKRFFEEFSFSIVSNMHALYLLTFLFLVAEVQNKFPKYKIE